MAAAAGVVWQDGIEGGPVAARGRPRTVLLFLSFWALIFLLLASATSFGGSCTCARLLGRYEPLL